MNYVIIGNSAGAIGCIEGIRQMDQKGSITLISDEPHHTYSRPLISYLLYGKTDERRMKYRPDRFYEHNQVETKLGHTVVKIGKESKQLLLDNDEIVPYDKLLVATGSRPFVPPMEGLDQVKKQFTFMTLDDAKALEAAISPKSRVLIVGAGLIGLKCAEGICDKVGSIAVVDLADRILPSILDVPGSRMVQRHIEGQGIEFYLSDSVQRFEPGKAQLKSGKTLEFDVLVLAVGVRPNTSLIQSIGGEVGRGILTDDRCATSLPDIYAAGDCTESLDITTGQSRVLALLPNAYMQGECAGINMAGGEKRYDRAMAMNAIGFFGLHIITAGSYEGEDFVAQGKESYKRLFTKNNRLIGYILIGCIERAGIYTALIREQTPLDSIDFELVREKPQLMAYTKKKRDKILGGAQIC